MEKEKWEVGKNFSYITSNIKPERASYDQHDWGSEKDYYGGYLIAESIPDLKKAKLIAAAPELLEACIKALDDCCDLIGTEAGKALENAIKKATE